MALMVEKIKNLFDSKESTDIFDDFLRNHTLLLNKINDLLDYSSLLKGSIKLEITKFDIRKMVNEIRNLYIK